MLFIIVVIQFVVGLWFASMINRAVKALERISDSTTGLSTTARMIGDKQ